MVLTHIDQQAALIIELEKRNSDLEARRSTYILGWIARSYGAATWEENEF
jgi:hypothetical protein